MLRSGRTYRCPLCDSSLSRSRYLAVTKEHAGLHRAIARAEAELARYKRLRAEAEAERKALEARHRRDLANVRTQAAAVAAARASRAAAKEVRAAKDALKRQQSRLTSYQKRFERVAQQRDAQAEEIARLREQIARGTTPQVEGLLEEARLLATLRQVFPKDKFAHTGKGGDIVHTVMCDSDPAGVIVYECKRVKVFHQQHLLQAARARQQRDATYALLVTNCLPKKKEHCWVERGVIVITPQAVVAVAMTARDSLETLYRLRASEADRQRAVRAIYDYLAGNEYAAQIANTAAELEALTKELDDERRWHDRAWRKRVAHYSSVRGDVSALDERLRLFLKRSGTEERGAPILPLRRGNGRDAGTRRSRRAAVA